MFKKVSVLVNLGLLFEDGETSQHFTYQHLVITDTIWDNITRRVNGRNMTQKNASCLETKLFPSHNVKSCKTTLQIS